MTPPPVNPPGGAYPSPYGYAPAPAPRPTWRGRLAVLLTSLTLLVIACSLPALIFKRSGGDLEVWSGAKTLLLGWMGILVKQMAWYANPVMCLSLIFLLFRRWLTAAIIALMAVPLNKSWQGLNQ